MYHNYVFGDINDALPVLMHGVVNGAEVGSRVGRTTERMHVGITLTRPWRREILDPGRKANIAAQIAETMWVLSGRNDVEWLSHYLPRAAEFSDDGETWRAGYGPRLRNWDPLPEDVRADNVVPRIDQLAEVVKLLRESIGTRRAVMSIWDPSVDYTDSKDIPCNNWINFSSRLGKLDMHVAIRSNDLMWGWSGINAFEWSALLEIVAGMVGVSVGAVHFSTTSLHLYERHWDKARQLAQSDWTEPADLEDSPRFEVNRDRFGMGDLDDLFQRWFALEEEIRTTQDVSMFAKVDSDIHDFPEPMLRSWLRVLRWWWTADRAYLSPLDGTRLAEATRVSVQPKRTAPEVEKLVVAADTPFMQHVHELHISKHEAYGDSWKRRGEMLGIMANIARKVDRLGGGTTEDETAADTAIDLMVYLAKYRWWLVDNDLGADPINTISFDKGVYSDDPKWANALMLHVEQSYDQFDMVCWDTHEIEKRLTVAFDRLEQVIVEKEDDRHVIVDGMLQDAYVLARVLWRREQAPVDRNATRKWDPEMPSHDH